MRKLQNTLYITTQGSYLHKERETLVVEQERKKVVQLPVHSIGHIFCFGNVLVSPFLLGFCGENNVLTISYILFKEKDDEFATSIFFRFR